jgi:NTE family protein
MDSDLTPGRTGGKEAPATAPRPNGTPFACVALLLQGGGALGAYQAGVYEALLAAGVEPTWIAGISIGAVNSAIIAGNPPEKRVERLRQFWEQVSDGDLGWAGNWAGSWAGAWTAPWDGLSSDGPVRGWLNQMAAGRIMAQGTPGFFTPRVPPPCLRAPASPGATSWYDTGPLHSTLERLVDFDRINTRLVRFSVGAVNVRTGNFTYFDNATHTIGPKHVMASGALPPAFEAVEIEGELYWDGGLVSNTPLDWVLSSRSELDTLIFQVDLWSARGEAPRDLLEVAVRAKEIQFSSRTRAASDSFRQRQQLRAVYNELLQLMPPELAATPQAQLLARASDPAVYNIVQLVYRSPSYEGQSKDYEFSRRTMEDHWAAGRRDAEITLAHPEVLTLPAGPNSVDVYDFISPTSRNSPVRTEKDPA